MRPRCGHDCDECSARIVHNHEVIPCYRAMRKHKREKHPTTNMWVPLLVLALIGVAVGLFAMIRAL